MLHVNIDKNVVEILREKNDQSEIKISGEHVQIGNDLRLKIGHELGLFVRYMSLGKPIAGKEAMVDIPTASPLQGSEKLTNSDFVVMALRELGRPMKSLDEILPILDRNGYTSNAKNRRSPIRYYLSTDERIVRTNEGWSLVERLSPEEKSELVHLDFSDVGDNLEQEDNEETSS